jgi:hypothetical protein
MNTPQLSNALKEALVYFQQLLTDYCALAQQEKIHSSRIAWAQKAAHCLTLLLNVRSIDDEELYAYWKAYLKEKTHWITTTFPNYKAATSQTIVPILVMTRQHLAVVIAAAQQYTSTTRRTKTT